MRAMFTCGCLLCASLPVALRAENWPQWRGPRGDGVSRERQVPVVWNAQRELAWKCPLPAAGNSTPVIWEDSLFVTGQADDGRLVLVHVGARSGKILWSRDVGTEAVPRGDPARGRQQFHASHNLATPSPVTNGQYVAVHFGNGDLAAYDFDGGQVWKRNLQADHGLYTIWYGHANSPTIFEDTVISVCLQDALEDRDEGPAESYVVAHDLATGRQQWKTLRMTGAPGEEADAYTTPLLVHHEGEPQLVVMGANQLDAYDPRNGRRLWYLDALTGGRTVTSPTMAEGTVFATRGKRGPLLAVPLVTRWAHDTPLARPRRDILWSDSAGTPDCCTPVAQGLLLFTVSDDGVARCHDAHTGSQKWKQRLPGQYKASPVIVAGRVLFLNTQGVCTVVSATADYDKLAENQLEDAMFASPALAHEHIYLRGSQTLYCIGRRFP